MYKHTVTISGRITIELYTKITKGTRTDFSIRSAPKGIKEHVFKFFRGLYEKFNASN